MSPRDPQAALEKANWVRAERARLHREVRAHQSEHESRVRVAQLFITTQPALSTMRALDLLRWAREMRLKDAAEMLGDVGATLFVTVGHLTVRQRLELMRLLVGDEDRS